ncbi:hypothetical protein QR680_018149 [Steinernema hermaphroditum]|uniref:Carboxylesterase type B domain-containing protein n=1 Tax=Steinernema hermaphroditum TaxID=289476 RepID=A0AA39LPW8_9BILA|nr:hypothetical protein QR680_018149 [Steinernema hermaphroditum]
MSALLAIALFTATVFARKSIVRTSLGELEGFEYETRHGKVAKVFLGIQYAVADRFESPKRVTPWDGTKTAFDYGSSCYPKARRPPRGNETFGEDCLYLNVFAPTESSPDGYAVLFYIFGGQLGPPLDFVHETIPSFGGDPERITVAGHSSGSACVSALTLSPHSNHLFAQAIHLSGSIFSKFMLYDRVVNESLLLASEMGCDGTSAEVRDCMKRKDVDDFYGAYERIGPVTDRIVDRRFYPLLDGLFFPSSLEELAKKAPKKPTLAGLTDMEGGFLTMGFSNNSMVSIPSNRWDSYGRVDLLSAIALVCHNITQLCHQMEEFYAKEDGNSTYYLTKLSQMVGDIMYNIPLTKEMSLKVDMGWPVYLYLQEHFSMTNRGHIPVSGAFHANEIVYLFGAALRSKMEFTDDDRRFQKDLLGAISSFVKWGRPHVERTNWDPATRHRPTRHIRFSSKNTMNITYFDESRSFWVERVESALLGAVFPWYKQSDAVDRIDLMSKANKKVFLCVGSLIAIVMIVLIALILFLTLERSHGGVDSDESPLVETPLGDVQGFRYREANVFLGIRFASAERFMPPNIVEPWNETYKATSFGSACYPYTSLPVSDVGSDDCLFMNIITPKEPSPEPDGYPILVFIHGGGFEFGSASHYEFEVIAQNFVSRGLIFVSFNYRLGPFGFFSTGDGVASGNNGLWDQGTALVFVHKVIESFGGDRNRITVSGQSAGSMSITALTLSLQTNGLFDQAIMMSGSLFAPALYSDRVVDQSQILARALGCNDSSSSENVFECVRSKNISDFYDVFDSLPPINDELIGIRFHPRLNCSFFSSDLRSLTRIASPKPTIIGITDTEAGLFTMSDDHWSPVAISKTERPTFGETQLERILRILSGKSEDFFHLLKQFYIDRSAPDQARDSSFYLTRLTEVASDATFNIPVIQEALIKKNAGWPMYLYLETNIESVHKGLPINGTFHNTDLRNLFHKVAHNAYQEAMIEGFVSFVKNGEPTVNGTHWRPITQAFTHFVFGKENEMSVAPMMKESMDFWFDKVATSMDKKDFSPSVPLVFCETNCYA